MVVDLQQTPNQKFFDPDVQQDDTIDFEMLLAIARRQWRLVALFVSAAAILGVLYILTAVPLYTANARMFIDSNNQKIVSELSAVEGITGDDASILSQVELLKSQKLSRAVVDKLNLIDSPEFQADGKTALSTAVGIGRSIVDVTSWFGDADEEIDREAAGRAATTKLLNNLAVSRIGRTYVLEIAYTSASPALASRIIQALADAYLVDQLDSKYDATRRASEWLQRRIEELRQKSLETDLAVQQFKAEKGLITTGGELISDQQLTQLNSQLILAQAEAAESEAKYTRIRNIIDSGQMDATVTETLNSPVINTLREKFLDASRREADIASRLGESHAQVIRLRNEMREYRRLIFNELSRIGESYQSNLEVAKKNLANLEVQVAQATGVSVTANDSQVQLRELERESETYKKLYETFLERYQEAVQQQSFPVNEARVISSSGPPNSPSFPKKSLTLVLSILLGGVAGSGVAAFREFRDRFFRTGDQVRQELDLEFLGSIPLKKKLRNTAAVDVDLDANRRNVIHSSDITKYVIDYPLSPFAEALRSAQLASSLMCDRKKPQIIGVVSCLPGEGKSTVAINFAELLAVQGNRTLLIDADLRNPGASRAIGTTAERGLMEVLLEGLLLQDAIMRDNETGLGFLPAVTKRRIPYSAELLASDAMRDLIVQAGHDFDFIVIDLPPLGPVIDAKAISTSVDNFLFVVEWGKTARKVVRSTLASNPQVSLKCAGVILNKVDSQKLKLYQAYGSSEYYYSSYNRYYTSE